MTVSPSVAEINPLKQGLKHYFCGCAFELYCSCRDKSTKTRIETVFIWCCNRYVKSVAEINPLKQGLKPVNCITVPPASSSCRDKSTKTRIETSLTTLSNRLSTDGCRDKSTKTRIETLKEQRENEVIKSCRDKSTKTRIETLLLIFLPAHVTHVAEINPLKQGLKPCTAIAKESIEGVAEINPLKQGLKPFNPCIQKLACILLQR